MVWLITFALGAIILFIILLIQNPIRDDNEVDAMIMLSLLSWIGIGLFLFMWIRYKGLKSALKKRIEKKSNEEIAKREEILSYTKIRYMK